MELTRTSTPGTVAFGRKSLRFGPGASPATPKHYCRVVLRCRRRFPDFSVGIEGELQCDLDFARRFFAGPAVSHDAR